MDPYQSQSPMLAKAPGVSTGRAVGRAADDPDALLKRVVLLLEKEQFNEARRAVVAAADRFPGHSRLQAARTALAGTARVVPGEAEGGIEQEIEWLRNPPADMRGKWVALSGNEVVGVAETAQELLRPGNIVGKALVVRVD